jgi:hypothetical protein
MVPHFQPHANISIYRLTEGAETYLTREEGKFIVIVGNFEVRFNTLVGAFLYYIDLPVEAELYDRTNCTDVRLVEVKRCLS